MKMGSCGEIKSSLDRCLFCCAATTTDAVPLKREFNGDVLIKEEVNCSGFYDVPSYTSGENNGDYSMNSGLERELRTIFIVRKLLELPVEKCADYLGRNDGGNNPSLWFSVCGSCDKNVEEGFKIYCQIEKLNKRLGEIRGSLINTIGKSKGCSNSVKGKKQVDDFIFVDIRNTLSGTTAPTFDDVVLEPRNTTRIGKRSLRNRKETLLDNAAFEAFHEAHYVSLDHWNDGDDDDVEWQPVISNHENFVLEHNSEELQQEQYSKQQAATFYCKFCKVSLFTKRRLESHMKRWHNDKFSLKCDTCGTGYTTPAILARHQKICKPFVEEMKVQIEQIPTATVPASFPENEVGFPQQENTSLNMENPTPTRKRMAGDDEIVRSGELETMKNSIRLKRLNRDIANCELPTNSETKKPKIKVSYGYRCHLCAAHYKTTTLLKIHQKLHDEKIGEPCSHCGWLCEEEKLQQHIDKRHGEKAFTPFEDLRRNHKEKMARQGRPPRQPKSYVYKRRLLCEIPFYCNSCQMIFTRESHLRSHWNTYHSDTPKHFCSTCNSVRGFETEQLLELHCKDEHSIGSNAESTAAPAGEPQICPHCSKPFPSKLKRDYHIAKLHKRELLICQICGFDKAVKYCDYWNHMLTKHEKKRFMCDRCPKSFSTDRCLKNHISVQHHMELGMKPEIVCEECHVIFANVGSLRIHVENVHKKIKKRTCEYCGKAFSTGSDLKKHTLLHTEPRERQYKPGPFFCEFCQAKFNVRQGLYYHLKKLHSDKYSFKCEYCGTGYVTKNTLLQHQRKCKGKLSSKPSSSEAVENLPVYNS